MYNNTCKCLITQGFEKVKGQIECVSIGRLENCIIQKSVRQEFAWKTS